MKILITYASTTGTTEKCAIALAEKLPGAVLANLKKEIIDPSDFDAVIVGGSIRGGVLVTEVQDYLENCAPILLKKRLGLFICCGTEGNVSSLFSGNMPEELVDHAVACRSFGGELAPERARGMDKFMIKLMAKSAKKDGTELKLYPERIDEFARTILAE